MAQNTDIWYLRHFVEIDNLKNRLVKVQYLDYLCIHSKPVQSIIPIVHFTYQESEFSLIPFLKFEITIQGKYSLG